MEYSEIVLFFLTFMMDPTMNLMRGSHHECERRKYHSPCFGSTYELLNIKIGVYPRLYPVNKTPIFAGFGRGDW